MRALQLMRDADLLWSGPDTIRLTPSRLKKPKYPEPVDERIYPTSARVLVREGWIEMTGFNPDEGVYRLSKTGRSLTDDLLCECKYRGRWGRGTHNKPAHDFTLLTGVDRLTTNPKIDWPKERLLCKQCWRLARCEAKFFKHPHSANRYIWGVGPICQFHVDNPMKR